MEKLQVHRCVVIMSVYSTCCRLHLQLYMHSGNGCNHFQHALELRERVKSSHSRMGSRGSDTQAWDGSKKRPITGINWYMSDIECNDILSCDCKHKDTDSSKGLLRLSGKNKLSQIMVSRNLFFFFVCVLHYTNTVCYIDVGFSFCLFNCIK